MSEGAPETPVAEVQKEEPAAPAAPAAGGAKGKGEDKGKKKGRKAFDLKTPKGTVDYDPWQMAIREKVFGIVTSCFKRHGAVTIETPVFELRETLMGKYGEDQKLIYDLADQGGEICSLRYDLTVPFARFMASNRTIKFLKRYHIGRVYRRDQPALTRGRYREFYQCDFDIAGQYDVMVPDAEVLKVATEILDKLEIGPYEIKINHRLVLDGMLEICGVPAEMFRPICSAIDKLDKSPWEEVRAEMVNVKKLDPEVADKIHPFVQLRGNCTALLQSIQANGNFNNSETAKEGLRQLGLLFEYLEAYGISERCVFDLSLARGLDYYTGLIFEATTLDKKVGVGSIAGGGRYDNLIGMFGGEIVPSVGFSVGIERVFTILEKQEKGKKKDDASRIRACPTQVLVISPDKGVVTERMKICAELWAVDIKAESVNKTDPPMKRQLAYADENQIPLAVIIGKKELEEGVVSVKDLKQRQQITIARAQMVPTLQAVLSGAALESFGSNPAASS